jgi:hypothetical protein
MPGIARTDWPKRHLRAVIDIHLPPRILAQSTALLLGTAEGAAMSGIPIPPTDPMPPMPPPGQPDPDPQPELPPKPAPDNLYPMQ